MELRAPAKINLFLKVVHRRADGYHELINLMCCVGLYDRIKLRLNAGATGISCANAQVPHDETNLALRAALTYHRALQSTSGRTPAPVLIQLTKKIPVGAGLGGGSSDAAAVLKGLNEHYGSPLSKGALLSLALELGADVPFFIDATPALARGVGEILTPYTGLAPFAVVLIYPGFGLSTGQVYRNLNLRLTKYEKKIRKFPFNNGDFLVPDHLRNDLEAAVLPQHPVIADLKSQLMAHGAKGALMSGSGSTVFGLFADMADAQQAAKVFRRVKAYQVFVTELLS